MQRVLILDGDISFIVRLRKALETQDFEVKTARRLSAAYEEIEAQAYDIAVVDLTFEDFVSVLDHLRAHHPYIPIILSGRTEEDAVYVNRVNANAYINKPYVARDLMTIIEWTLAKIASGEADTDPTGLDFATDEPTLDESATIGDMMTAWLNTSENDVVVGDFPPDSLPESTAELAQNVGQNTIEEPPVSIEDSVASRVLRFSHDDTQVAHLWQPTGPDIMVKPLPSWQVPPTPDDQAKILDLLGELPQLILPPQANAIGTPTRPVSLPEIDLVPEDPTPMPDLVRRADQLNIDLLEALAEAEDAEDSRLQATLRGLSKAGGVDTASSDPSQEQLVSASVKEITQSMGIVLDTDEADDMPAATISEAEAEATLVAQAALQLTQLSLESAAIGTMLTYEGRMIANIGDLTATIWHDVATQIAAAWEQSDGSNTRLVYRMLDRHGQVLMFSLKTADDLILTLIFSANTPLKVIRRQAKRITEALANVELDALSVELDSSHTLPEAPPAATTSPSRPTDLKPPADLRKATSTADAVTKPPREDGNYTGYALVWLIQNQTLSIDETFKDALSTWLARIADEELWDIVDLDIQEGWVNVHIEVPAKTLPSAIATTFMRQTEQATYDAYADLRAQAAPIWSESYSILTPGRLMDEREIERFIRYHTLADS